MDNLNDKQRRLVRLAYGTKDPELRRRAVEKLVTARYRPEFMQVVRGQRFRHPQTGNQVMWNSLPSQAQKAIYQQWQQAEAARGGGGEGGGGRDEGGGGGGGRERPREDGGGDRKYADRTALHSTRGRKKDDDRVRIGPDSPLRRLAVPNGMSDEQKAQANEQLDRMTYGGLKKLRKHVSHALEAPDGPYMDGLKRLGMTADSVRDLGKALDKEIAKGKGKKFHNNVLEAANANDLEEIDADVLEDFRRDKPGYGRRHTWQELFQKFLNHRLTKPETRERMKDMSLDDFKKMYLSILKEEDEEEEAPREASEQERSISIFEAPAGGGRQARLTTEGRRIVRAAYKSRDQELRRRVLGIVRRELVG